MNIPQLIVKRGAIHDILCESRRMWNMKEKYRQLIVNKEAEKKIDLETHRYPNLETAWANYGFILPDGSVYLAGIIPPLDGCIDRGYAHNTLGGERLGYAVLWLAEHSKQINKNVNARFTELYKGHSHHQLGLSSFSAADVNSIIEFVRDNANIEVAVGPLSIIQAGPIEREIDQEGLIYQARQINEVHVKYYMYTREMLEAGIMRPSPVKSIKYVDDLPGITVPRLGWQFLGEREYNRQLSGLRASGYQVTARDMTPPTISWFIKKPAWSGGMVVIDIPLGFPDIPAVIGALPVNRSFFEVDAPGSDLRRIIQSLDKEMTPDGTSQSVRTS